MNSDDYSYVLIVKINLWPFLVCINSSLTQVWCWHGDWNLVHQVRNIIYKILMMKELGSNFWAIMQNIQAVHTLILIVLPLNCFHIFNKLYLQGFWHCGYRIYVIVVGSNYFYSISCWVYKLFTHCLLIFSFICVEPGLIDKMLISLIFDLS